MATLNQKSGTLATFTGTGNGTSYVSADGAAAILFTMTSTGASGGTIELNNSIDSGTNWSLVVGSPQTPTSATVAIGATGNGVKTVSISNPVGIYRAACTAHTNGTHTVKYRCAHAGV